MKVRSTDTIRRVVGGKIRVRHIGATHLCWRQTDAVRRARPGECRPVNGHYENQRRDLQSPSHAAAFRASGKQKVKKKKWKKMENSRTQK